MGRKRKRKEKKKRLEGKHPHQQYLSSWAKSPLHRVKTAEVGLETLAEGILDKVELETQHVTGFLDVSAAQNLAIMQ